MAMNPEAGTGARRAWGVAALLLAANDALQARFGACVVRGELSGYTRAGSGHCYFTLKDADGNAAALRCAMFRRAAMLLDFAPRDGMQVELRGRLAVYDARGELQLVVEAMQRVGAGSLYEQFLRLKAKLEAEGVFDAGRKRPLPRYPSRIGVVTSLNAAALHDVLTTLARRAPHVEVRVYPSPVQGADAPAALVEALHYAAGQGWAEVLLLCRGGGSIEDLWAFNDERLARAIAASAIPLVCGVGHETDITLADLAADVRAATPTAAAELCAPAQADVMAALQSLATRMQLALHRQVDGRALRTDQLAWRLARPGQLLAAHGGRLTRHEERQRQALKHALQAQRERQRGLAQRLTVAAGRMQLRADARTDALAVRLQAVDPRRVLARGYAWVTDEQGQAVVSSAALHAGQRVRAVWADGVAEAKVERIEARTGKDAGRRSAG